METQERRNPGPKPRYTARVVSRVSPEQVTELERIAEERQLTVSATVRQLLAEATRHEPIRA